MKSTVKEPQTLMDAIKFFAKPGVALEFMAKMRWPNGPFCESCGEMEPMFLKSVERWKCRGCRKQFSLKRGTIMEDSPLPLDKWLCAIWMIANCRNGVSSYEIARALGITQKSAWFMLHRIRLAMEAGTIAKAKGTVEMDEAFMGPKVGRMNRKSRRRAGPQRSSQGKTAVIAIAERDGEVRAKVLPDVKTASILPYAINNIEAGSKLFTDESTRYKGAVVKFLFDHQSVDHGREEYVRGDVHTNTVENFWSLLKRSIRGTYINVEPFHLARYVEEQVFRYNNRKESDAGRFSKLLSKLAGKRITFDALIGRMEPQTC